MAQSERKEDLRKDRQNQRKEVLRWYLMIEEQGKDLQRGLGEGGTRERKCEISSRGTGLYL